MLGFLACLFFERKKVELLSNPWRRWRARRRPCRRRLRAKTLTLAHNSQTIQDIQMKLGTHVARDNMHIARAIILTLIFIELCRFFDLEITDERWRSLRVALV